MELANVYIENFRSIKRMKFSFEPRCRILVGMNESGKSNILAALSHLDRDKKIQPGDLREIAPEEDEHSDAFIRFEFDLSSEDTQKIAHDIGAAILGPLVPQYKGKPLDLLSLIHLRPKGLFSVDIRKKIKYASYWQINSLVKMPDGFFVMRDSASSEGVKLRLPTGEEQDADAFQITLLRSTSATSGQPKTTTCICL